MAFGEYQATQPVQALLDRNGILPEQVTMICHQASMKIISVWQQALPGITILNTIASYANMVLATIPANLDVLGSQIATDYLMTLGLGVQLHAGALLFSRQGSLPVS